MKKTAMKISGNITLILFFLLFLAALLNTLIYFEIDFALNLMKNSIVSNIVLMVAFTFVAIPQYLLKLAGLNLAGDTVALVFTLLLCVFCLLMFLWGIKEVKLSRLDDEKFARCKKSCAFMMITKFMFFAYMAAVVVCSSIVDEISVAASAFSTLLNVNYIYLIVSGVLTFLAFLMFILPFANILVVASAVKQDQANFSPTEGYVVGSENEINIDNNNGEQSQGFYNQAPAPTMQANMPPMQGFRPQMVQQPTTQVNPQQPQVAPQPQVVQSQPVVQPQQTIQQAPVQPVAQQAVQPQAPAPQQPAITTVTPVQPQVVQQVNKPQPAPAAPAPVQVNGATDEQLVANLTEQGVAELQRIDRLKSIGAITDQNYAVMRQKILTTNQK